MALVPFEPSSSDLEKAIIDVTEGQTISLLTDLPTTSNAKFTPGSTWENHRIIPGEYIPDDDDKDFSLLKGDIGRVNIDGLRDFDKDDLSSSKFTELFSYLSVCMRTGISEETILKREHGRERVLSDLSLLSTSSDEDKAEDASERACQYFISGILDSFQSIRFLSLEKGKYEDKLAVETHHQTLTWTMADSHICNSKNDGGLCVVAMGSVSNSPRHSTVPVISIEAKRRHAGGIKRPSGEPQPHVPELIGQEFGEMLGQAYEQRKLGYEQSTPDQEAFVASMHGTQFRLSCAYFSDKYLTCVKQMDSTISTSPVYFRRSRAFEMKDPSDRVEASRLLLGALKYIRSGKARIATLQAVL